MDSVFDYLFGAASFVPHGYCLLWRPDLVAIHAISDLLIALAYFAIPAALWYFARRRSDLEFKGVFYLFAAFILLCGLTHLIDLITLWAPIYGLQGLVKAVTAAVSLLSAYALLPIIPKALALPGLSSLKEANQQMARTVVTQGVIVAARTAELEAVNRELEAFAYAAAHDLRTPLRCINGFSSALAEEYGGQLDASGRLMVDRIHVSSMKMAGLIDDLLHMSRLVRKPLRIAKTNLSAKVRSIVAALREEAPDRTVDVEIAEDVIVDCDRELMRIALTHLLRNAWKFTSGKSPARIEFDCRQEDGESWFYVRDNGVGFDMAYADKLFLPFERLHATTEYPGNGIGLAIVSRIIARHGGEIRAESSLGKGASIQFSLNTRAAKAAQQNEECYSAC